ncbi:C6 finger domain-containing protein [Hypoxylon sp. NC0597]|nr:C6 finger domain-containing protein [Hypoxylon sp. NC0597]
MSSGSALPTPRRVPKLGHKKSLFGCQRCRSRRVKCNEEKPTCHNCKRHGLPCIYDRDAFSKRACEKTSTTQMCPKGPEEDDPPESRSRRVMETKLMHQYLIETGITIAADELTKDVFARQIPELSYQSDGLLYSMYALAALHLTRLGKDEEIEGGAENAASRYFSMAVREHNREISQVSKETADLVSLTSCLMRAIAISQLQNRSRQPYVPPWQWLTLARTSISTFVTAYEQVGPDPKSLAVKLIRETAHLHDEGKLPGGSFERLQHLMNPPKEPGVTEPWDAEVQDAYGRTLSYICKALEIIDEEGWSGRLFRMVLIFPMLSEHRYVELVRQESPRALVILAHYFALLVRFHDVWWVGSVGTDEIRAIASALPDEWKHLLSWPLEVIGQ